MNYQISDDEFSQLQSVRSQMGLVESLLCANGADSALFDASDLHAFLSAQTNTLLGVIKEIEQRYELMRAEPRVNGFDLAHMIRILRGKANYTPTNSEARIAEVLAKCAAIDEGMRPALDAWIDALVEMGEEQRSAEKPQVHTKTRKRDKLVAA